VSLDAKYTAAAESFSGRDYADPERYYARRAHVLVTRRPRLAPGATLLDLACGDGGLGRHLVPLGIDYRGVDANARMVEVARRALGDRVVQGEFDYEPPAVVDATTVFRSLYLVPDRRAFFRRVRSYTTAKLVFDFDPRAYDSRAIVADLEESGFREITLRPFLTPQRSSLPRPVQSALWALEGVPGSRAITRVRFPILVSASPA